jgi:hypothetical protein
MGRLVATAGRPAFGPFGLHGVIGSIGGDMGDALHPVGELPDKRLFAVHDVLQRIGSRNKLGTGPAGSAENTSFRELKPLETVQFFLDAAL